MAATLHTLLVALFLVTLSQGQNLFGFPDPSGSPSLPPTQGPFPPSDGFPPAQTAFPSTPGDSSPGFPPNNPLPGNNVTPGGPMFGQNNFFPNPNPSNDISPVGQPPRFSQGENQQTNPSAGQPPRFSQGENPQTNPSVGQPPRFSQGENQQTNPSVGQPPRFNQGENQQTNPINGATQPQPPVFGQNGPSPQNPFGSGNPFPPSRTENLNNDNNVEPQTNLPPGSSSPFSTVPSGETAASPISQSSFPGGPNANPSDQFGPFNSGSNFGQPVQSETPSFQTPQSLTTSPGIAVGQSDVFPGGPVNQNGGISGSPFPNQNDPFSSNQSSTVSPNNNGLASNVTPTASFPTNFPPNVGTPQNGLPPQINDASNQSNAAPSFTPSPTGQSSSSAQLTEMQLTLATMLAGQYSNQEQVAEESARNVPPQSRHVQNDLTYIPMYLPVLEPAVVFYFEQRVNNESQPSRKAIYAFRQLSPCEIRMSTYDIANSSRFNSTPEGLNAVSSLTMSDLSTRIECDSVWELVEREFFTSSLLGTQCTFQPQPNVVIQPVGFRNVTCFGMTFTEIWRQVPGNQIVGGSPDPYIFKKTGNPFPVPVDALKPNSCYLVPCTNQAPTGNTVASWGDIKQHLPFTRANNGPQSATTGF